MFSNSGPSYNEMTDEQFVAATPERLKKQKSDNLWKLRWLTGLKLNETEVKYLGVDDVSAEKAQLYFNRPTLFERFDKDYSASFLETKNVNGVVDSLLESQIANNLGQFKNSYEDSYEITYTPGSLTVLADILKVLKTSKNLDYFDGNSVTTKSNLKKIIDTVLQNSHEFRFYSKTTLNNYIESLNDFLNSEYLSSSSYSTSNIKGNLNFLLEGMKAVAKSLPDDPKVPESKRVLDTQVSEDGLLIGLPEYLRTYELSTYHAYTEFITSNAYVMDGLNDDLDIHLVNSDLFKYFPINELFLSYFIEMYKYKKLMDNKEIPDKSNSPIVISDIPVNLALKIIHLFPDLKISYRDKKISKPDNIKKVLGLLSNSTEVVTISGKFSDILDNPNFQKLVDKAVDIYSKKNNSKE